MSELAKTPLHATHVAAGAQMVDFGGWDMPVQYPQGIVKEHLATRKHAGIFDVSHMGRFYFRGGDALPFLQHVLTGNAAALDPGMAQYTLIPNENGGAIDDAYLYYFDEGEYLLVVNAANRQKDWDHFQSILKTFKGDVSMEDRTSDVAMISLQGPASKDILRGLMDGGILPEPVRNALGSLGIKGIEVQVGRTGYTGEPICFELFVPAEHAERIWNLLTEAGAQPVGLGARDTLRLEAGLPLYGHELGIDKYGKEFPIFAISLARFAVSFSPLKGDFIGKAALQSQFEALQRILNRDYTSIDALPRRVKLIALTGKGLAREGSTIFKDGKEIGYITSGTMVPYWDTCGECIFTELTDDFGKRAIGLAYIDADILKEDEVEVEVRGKRIPAVVVPYHLRSEAAPYSHAITSEEVFAQEHRASARRAKGQVESLVRKAVQNTEWRQHECINLIPSEMTASRASRLLSIMDPVNRYAEHKEIKAFKDAEVFYYQGTDFIGEVEQLLMNEFRKYLGCTEVETRVISGQMANTAVFSAMVDYINRVDRKREPLRMHRVMNNHIIRGGHLSAQPMGALRDFVARNPKNEQPAVVNFPVLEDNPYKIDVEATVKLVAENDPELIILGKSMILHPEPVKELRKAIDDAGLDTILMYDMAHVLGLIGPSFQNPFAEGADVVTGSTHKTFFGTQRGVIGVNVEKEDKEWMFWKAIQRRAFPGSVSNHHLGTMLGLLMAAYEMNHFKGEYQPKVIANAKAFARALSDAGLKVEGDPAVDFTETHQVVLDVGYARGPEVARLLEENNIVVNYQAKPDDEGFSASGGLRLGVSEMTRFGMETGDFAELAQLMKDVIVDGTDVRDKVTAFRSRFLDMRYCFAGDEFDPMVEKLASLV